MKKMITLVLALVFMLGFASVATAMGPDSDPTNVGFVLTDFKVADQMLSPLSLPNWSGAIDPNKVISEGQPIWFVAHYVQRPQSNPLDTRDFDSNAKTRKTVFTAKDNTINWQFSSSYMNFVWIKNLEVRGGNISLIGGGGKVSAEEDKLEVTMAGGAAQLGNGHPTLTSEVCNLMVATVPNGETAQNYYLQIMAFTKACNEAQGTVYARTPIDVASFDGAATLTTVATGTQYTRTLPTTSANFDSAKHMLQVYDDAGSIKYKVVRFQIGAGTTDVANLNNIGAASGDYIYVVYDSDNVEIIGFVSNNSSYKGLVKLNNGLITPVQWTSDDGGKWKYTDNSGVVAISDADLKVVMSFFGFSFGNNYPILARHVEAKAGYWMTKEAKYNVAAAVITVPDGDTDPVPKTGDTASSMGLIMIAIALSGLAAVGFVVSKRVRG